VFDRHRADRLLLKLIAKHGEAGRPEIAPELIAAEHARARSPRTDPVECLY
jgi:hypothetical protein